LITVHDYSLVCPVGYNIHKTKECQTGLRIKCILSHRHCSWIRYILRIIYLYKQKKAVHLADIIHTPSPRLKEYLEKNNFQNVVHIPYILDKKPFTPVTNHKKILYVGRLDNEKGVDLLIKEFKIVLKKHPDTVLDIVGKGPQKKSLQNLANKIKNINFYDWTNNPEQFYKKCSLVVVPSIWMEQASLVISEAMSFARPVICSNRGGNPWLLDYGKAGLLFNPYKKGQLAKKINTLIENTNLSEYYAIKGYKHINKLLNSKKNFNKILELYNTLIQQSQ